MQRTPPDLDTWFANSRVVDAAGEPCLLFHGTKAIFTDFDPTKTRDGGIHFGTQAQAQMRAGKSAQLLAVYLRVTKPRRSRDMGGNWQAKIKSARAAGHDGIVYLNRYEGIPREAFERLQALGLDPDKLSDAAFRKLVPEASDSWIVWQPEQILRLEDLRPETGISESSGLTI